MNGCEGADSPQYGLFFAESLKGQSAHEFGYPYLDDKPKLKCPTNVTVYNSGAYVKEGLADYECDEDKLKILVSTYGAAVTSLYASDPGFRNYGGGVLATCAKEPTNHAVLVTGYGKDEATGLDYWVIRNSWGTNWGKDGYIKIVRGQGACSIGKKCYAAKCLPTTGTISG
jgi:C1A family cysteine protease